MGGGAHGAVLHWNANDGELDPKSLLLIDAAMSFKGYTSDVTRTWPVDGVWSAAQKALYRAVFGAQKAAIDLIRPGVMYADMVKASQMALLEVCGRGDSRQWVGRRAVVALGWVGGWVGGQRTLERSRRDS